MLDTRRISGKADTLAVSTLLVMAGFLASRVLGVVREMVIGAQFGTSGQYDAYIAAFRIPDTMFLLISGGALSSAFLPFFAGLLGKDDDGAWRLYSAMISLSLAALSAAAIIAALIAPQLIDWVIAPGFSPEQKRLTTDLTRILLFSPLFLSLSGFASAALNSHSRFLMPAFAPAMYNLLIICGAIALAPTMGAYGLAAGAALGTFAHLLIQVPDLVKVGMRYMPTFGLRDPLVRQVGRVFVPRVFGQAAFQLNFIVMTSIASRLPAGSISSLNYAFALMMLPHGIFAMSVSTVAFPTLARHFGSKEMDQFRRTLASAIRFLLYLTLPASVGLAILRVPVVRTILQFRAFTEQSTEAVAWALLFFAAGLFAFAVVEIVTRAFYALKDTRTPVIITASTIAINIVLSLVLVGSLGHGGLALSFSMTTVLEMVLMLIFINRRVDGLDVGPLAASTARSLAGSAVMGVVLYVFVEMAGANAAGGRSLTQLAWLLAAVALGGLVYLGVTVLLGSEEARQARSLVRRVLRRG